MRNTMNHFYSIAFCYLNLGSTVMSIPKPPKAKFCATSTPRNEYTRRSTILFMMHKLVNSQNKNLKTS